MDVEWSDPRVVSLHERLAATIQREYEDSLTCTGSVVSREYLGARAAVEILRAAIGTEFGPAAWTLSFTPDPAPNPNVEIGCVYCRAKEGELHDEDACSRTGVLRPRGAEVKL
jgi:hypothetical protein